MSKINTRDHINYGSLERSDSSEDETLLQTPKSQATITTLENELIVIAKSSAPLIITLFLQYSLTVVSIFSVGHIGKVELAAVSLATMTFNISNAVFTGMSTCLDTLCSQAFGAGKKELVGMHFQRCSVMIFMISIPIIFIWWCSKAILDVFVDDENITELAQFYLRIISFGTPGFVLFETGKRFLQSQGIFHAAQYVLFICTPINVVLNYLLVWDSSIGIGFAGAPLSIVITYNTMAVLLFVYAAFIDGKQCWNGLQFGRTLENWGPMSSLALPGVIMVVAEFFAFELLTLAAARLGTDVLAAQSVVSALGALTFQIPFGVSIASSTRIATHIGSQSLINARISTKVAMVSSLLVGSVSAVALYLGRGYVVNAFTNDIEVSKLAIPGIKVLAVNQLWDSANVMAAGCLRGQGRQKIGGYLNILSYYLVAIPLALYFAFNRELGLVGLWVGLGCGIFVLAGLETYFTFNADWDVILTEALIRNSN